MSKVSLIFFGFDDSIALIRDLKSFYKDSSKFDVETINTAAEVNQFISSVGNGIFFFKVTNKLDMRDAVTVLKAQKKLIKKGLLKPACISGLTNKKVESVLAKYGCMDVLEPTTRAKTITFKLDFWSKPIVAHLAKMEREEELKSRKDKQAKATALQPEKKEDFVLQKPLELESDIWLIKAKTDYKKILRRWLVRMLGPSPYIGSWVEVESQPGTWRYLLKNPESKTFVCDDGSWFFKGNKPEFDWKINRWIFPSEAPHLYFYAQDGTVYSRFKYEGGHVKLCENSVFAKTREGMILKTCDSKFNIEGDATENDEGENLAGDSETDNLSNMEGKGSTEELAGDPLSGKGGAADQYGADSLSGKSSTDKMGEDPLSGEGSAADQLGNDPFAGKSSTDKFGKDPLSGKSSTDNLDGGPISGKTKNKRQESDDDSNNEFSEAGIKKHYDGKGSEADHYGDDALSGKGSAADRLGEDPLAGKDSKSDEYGKDPLGGKGSSDDLGGPLGGKGSAADHFGDDPLSGKAGTDDLGGPLAGKSSTDKMGEDPLSGKAGTDDLGGPLDGKSSTDKMGEDPQAGKPNKDDLGGALAGKNSANSRKNTDPKKNKFREESLQKHYEGEEGPDGKPMPPKLDDQGNPVLDPVQLSKDEEDSIILDPEAPEGFEDTDDDLSAYDVIDGMGKKKPPGLEKDELNKIIDNKEKKEKVDNSETLAFDRLKKPTEDSFEDGFDSFKEDSGQKKQGASGDPLDLTKTANDQGAMSDTGYLEDIKRKKAEKFANAAKSAEEVADELRSLRDKKKQQKEREAKITAEGMSYLDDKKPKQSPGKESTEKKQVDTKNKTESGKNLYGKNKESEVSKAASIASEMDDALGGGLTEFHEKMARANDDIKDGGPTGNLDDDITDNGPSLDKIMSETPPDLNLESGELKVIVKQKTQAGNEITFMCDFEDFYEDELIVLSPKNSLTKGTDVFASVSLQYNGKRIKLAVEGTIEDIEELDNKKDTLVIAIGEIDKKQYDAFITLYQDRQGSINDFMERAKGY